MNKKVQLLYFFFALCLVIAVFILGATFLFPNKQKQESTTASPTPALPGKSSVAKAPITYDKQKTKELLDIVRNRPMLSEQDKTIRDKLIASLANKSGQLDASDTYIISYVKSPDDFEVEITTVDIAKAKAQATAWFSQQGISQEGICHFPVVFSLSFQVLKQLENSNMKFNPLPESC